MVSWGMGATPINLYRNGNAGSPRLDRVRPKDVRTFQDPQGGTWVIGLSGGVSTFASALPGWSGRWWKLPQNSQYDDRLLLRRTKGNHWQWEPVRDMLLSEYEAALRDLNRSFV